MPIAFLDIDTQVDIMLPDGTLPVPGATALLPNIRALIKLAWDKEIPLISTVHAHPPESPTCRNLPNHCVIGTRGQQKVDGTLWDDTYIIPRAKAPVFPPDAVQLIVEKDHSDLFTNPNADALLKEVGADTYYVFGLTTDNAVKMAVDGLHARGKHVVLITDAICAKQPDTGATALDAMRAAGAKLLTTVEVAAKLG